MEKNSKISKIFFIFLCLFIIINCHEITEDEINKTVDDRVITCGSPLRIQNVMTKFK